MKILWALWSFFVGECKQPRPVSRSAGFLLIPALFGLCSSAFADTTFNYVGPAFTSIWSNEPTGYPPNGAGTGPDSCNQPERDHPGVISFCKAPPGDPLDVADYDTSMRITGSFTLSDDENCEPPDWLANHRDGYDCINNWMCLESYSFTDGRVEFSYSRLDDVAPDHVVKCFGPTIYAANPPTFPEPRITYWHIWLEYRPPTIYKPPPDEDEHSPLNIGVKSYFLSTRYVRNVTPVDYGQILKCTFMEAGCTGARYDKGQARSFPQQDAWSVVSTHTNEPPIADAGLDQSVQRNSPVTLNGAGSYDPEGGLLTYDWQLFLGASEITGELSEPTDVNPQFTANIPGPPDYRAVLTVTDVEGLASDPDDVIVSTFNTPPVAHAGDDQGIVEIGTLVTLTGTESYDDDGDDITYQWTLTVKPAGSAAVLSAPDTVSPSFTPDLYGEYTASLVVNDGYANSEPDEVLISFNNVPPVANAGGDQAVAVGDTVYLFGEGTDENLDLLTYQWSLVTKPEGSSAALANDTTANASFIADRSGTFVVSLIVDDGLLASDPDNASIIATDIQSQIIENVGELIDIAGSLPPDAVKNRNLRKAMTNKLAAVIAMVDEGDFESARDKLVHDLMKKMDGCAASGRPDRNDWIVSCHEQNFVQPKVQWCVDTLGAL